MSRTRPNSQTQKVTLITLGVVAVATVFFLPQFVTEPWIISKDVENLEAPPPAPEDIAPSTAAELTKYRQDSQGVLAEIIVIRDRLTERNVEFWAEADFLFALGKVEVGDKEYSFGDYEQSRDLYREARDQLADLVTLGEQKLIESKAQGLMAVESLNFNVASSASELAVAISAQDPEVQTLVGRVETLPQVSQHIEAGDHAMERDRFEVARTEYRKANELDSAHKRAREGMASAQAEIIGGAFRGQMSRGFAALENQNYAGARLAFRKAGEIEPSNPAVAQALAQVKNRESLAFVNQQLVVATDLEAQEAWADALVIYRSLLATDPTLTDAKARLIPAGVRADLDEQLSEYIDDPLTLSNKKGFENAQVTLKDAQGISNAGPRLSGQIDQLATLLERATSPVNVVFSSDNQTHVVLYRVAELGTFQQTSMRLRPGRYVAAGTRDGYRDVRVEFTITGDPMDEPIVVRCEEPIG